MNKELESIGKEILVASFKVLSRHLSRGSEENREILQSGEQVSLPRFEVETSEIRSISVHHSAVTFGPPLTQLADQCRSVWLAPPVNV